MNIILNFDTLNGQQPFYYNHNFFYGRNTFNCYNCYTLREIYTIFIHGRNQKLYTYFKTITTNFAVSNYRFSPLLLLLIEFQSFMGKRHTVVNMLIIIWINIYTGELYRSTIIILCKKKNACVCLHDYNRIQWSVFVKYKYEAMVRYEFWIPSDYC